MSEDELLEKVDRHLDYKQRVLVEQLEAVLHDCALEWTAQFVAVVRKDVANLVRELYRGDEASEQ